MTKAKIILNGAEAKPVLLQRAAAALSNPDMLAERGGFLLKATMGEVESYIDIVPCILNDARMYHYDMKLKVETDFTLVGAVDANGVFTLFFQPRQAVLAKEDKEQLVLAYSRLASLLIENGYHGQGELDWSTQQLLTEAGVCHPAPETLAQLAGK